MFTFAAASLVTNSSQAVVYEVNRLFTEGFSIATLTGTVDVPIGNYVIQNTTPNPFTAVDLTLTVNASTYNLTNVSTDSIYGSGQFTIDATPTTLTFNASGDISNPADLVFHGNHPLFINRYVIGSNGFPAFEVAYTDAGTVGTTGVSFPTVFGTAVPEPSSLLLIVAAGMMFTCRRFRS
jgi:hypothetical protein